MIFAVASLASLVAWELDYEVLSALFAAAAGVAFAMTSSEWRTRPSPLSAPQRRGPAPTWTARGGGTTMKLADDDLMTWIFNGQRIACRVEKAREMLRADHLDWSDEQIEQELFARVAVGDERRWQRW
jgi:hypothetical protein